jgi:hypothetical protein
MPVGMSGFKVNKDKGIVFWLMFLTFPHVKKQPIFGKAHILIIYGYVYALSL